MMTEGGRGQSAGAKGERGRVIPETGMSGAGRSTALRVLKDFGYEAFDNLFLSLIPALIESVAADAGGADLRMRGFEIESVLEELGGVVAHSAREFGYCSSTVMTSAFRGAIRKRAGPTPLPATGP